MSTHPLLSELAVRMQAPGYDIITVADRLACAPAWCALATEGDLELMLAGAQSLDRERLVELLRDVLCQYPAMVYGAPVMLDWHSRDPGERVLPITAARAGELQFLGWLPPDAGVLSHVPPGLLPMQIINTDEIRTAIAVFRAPDDAPADCPSDSFWADLFAGSQPGSDTILISSLMLLPLPDSIESARVMRHAGSSGEPVARYFLSEHAADFAQAAGQRFVDSCAERANFR